MSDDFGITGKTAFPGVTICWWTRTTPRSASPNWNVSSPSGSAVRVCHRQARAPRLHRTVSPATSGLARAGHHGHPGYRKNIGIGDGW